MTSTVCRELSSDNIRLCSVWEQGSVVLYCWDLSLVLTGCLLTQMKRHFMSMWVSKSDCQSHSLAKRKEVKYSLLYLSVFLLFYSGHTAWKDALTATSTSIFIGVKTMQWWQNVCKKRQKPYYNSAKCPGQYRHPSTSRKKVQISILIKGELVTEKNVLFKEYTCYLQNHGFGGLIKIFWSEANQSEPFV